MRKYILNIPVWSAAFSFIGLAKTTASGPRDWRLILMWVSWGLTVAIAVGTIVKDAQNQNELED